MISTHASMLDVEFLGGPLGHRGKLAEGLCNLSPAALSWSVVCCPLSVFLFAILLYAPHAIGILEDMPIALLPTLKAHFLRTVPRKPGCLCASLGSRKGT